MLLFQRNARINMNINKHFTVSAGDVYNKIIIRKLCLFILIAIRHKYLEAVRRRKKTKQKLNSKTEYH